MATYKEQLEIIESIPMGSLSYLRTDCPFCGGKRTLGISVKDGLKLYGCYRASCGSKGKLRTERGTEAIRNALSGRKEGAEERRSRSIPTLISDIRNHEHVMAYLASNHCLYAIEHRLIRADYAPADNRILFREEGDLASAYGRSLDDRQKPKWLAYGEPKPVFTVGRGTDLAIVVEDIASACAVSSLATGVAILGTNITYDARRTLRAFKKVMVALDKDASAKALKEAEKVNGVVRLLDCDLKWLEPEEIRERLNL